MKTLKKGQKIKYIGYTIFNCRNNDGIVLSNESENADFYECHLGNYGNGDAVSVLNAKVAAVVHYMIARPDVFATTIMQKIMRGAGSGTQHEYYLLKNQLEKDGFTVPEEITCSNDTNCMILFNGKPFKWQKNFN